MTPNWSTTGFCTSVQFHPSQSSVESEHGVSCHCSCAYKVLGHCDGMFWDKVILEYAHKCCDSMMQASSTGPAAAPPTSFLLRCRRHRLQVQVLFPDARRIRRIRVGDVSQRMTTKAMAVFTRTIGLACLKMRVKRRPLHTLASHSRRQTKAETQYRPRHPDHLFVC